MILIFAGAGASAAVDRNQYPTTAEFFARLPSEITNKPWFKAVAEFLVEKYEGQTVDIEHLLDALREMQDFCVKAYDPNKISGRMLSPTQDRLRNIDREKRGNLHREHRQILIGFLRSDDRSLELLQNEINALVYEFYAAVPSEAKLNCWKRLLTRITTAPQHVELFTTNYDVVLEQVILDDILKDEIETGRIDDGLGRRLELSYWDPPLEPIGSENQEGLLTKLHGSVDWLRVGNGRTVTGCQGFTGDHDNHLALYPGHKGEPLKEPFMAFHNHLRLMVRSADAAIFVGFSFRDEYINQILSGLSSGVPKYVITKEQSNAQDQGTQIPEFLSDAERVREGFTRDSVNSCLEFLMEHKIIG